MWAFARAPFPSLFICVLAQNHLNRRHPHYSHPNHHRHLPRHHHRRHSDYRVATIEATRDRVHLDALAANDQLEDLSVAKCLAAEVADDVESGRPRLRRFTDSAGANANCRLNYCRE